MRLGSGRSPAGADLRIDLQDLVPWPADARARLASVVGGGSRGTFEGSLGVLHAGLAFPDAPGSAPLAMGGLHLEGAGAEVEASHIGDPGRGAWRLVLRSRGELLRQEWSIRRRESSDSSPASGGEEATARISWKREGLRLDWEGAARDDSLARREVRTVAAVSQDFAGLVWRLRGRWRGGDVPSTSALVPGVRRLRGRFRPWGELSWSTGSGARPSAGAAWVDRGWRLEASATRRTGGAWDWTSSSTLGGDGSSLEMRLSERDSELAGGGSWTLAW